MKVQYSFCGLILLCLLSCATFTERPIPDVSPRLVVNALFNPDSTWKINVSRNTTIDDTAFFAHYLADATVKLWEEETFLGELAYASSGNYVLPSFPQVGLTYRVEVSAPGYEPVWAENQIPQISEELSTLWELDRPVSLTDELGAVFQSYPLTLSLTDVPEETNYYRVGITFRDSCACDHANPPFMDRWEDRLHKTRASTQDPIVPAVSRQHGLILMEDVSFADQAKALELYADTTGYLYNYFQPISFQPDSILNFRGISFSWPIELSRTPRKERIEIYVDVWSISAALHDYYLSYLTQAYNTADPLAVHLNVVSNVVGGRGIFAGYQRRLVLAYSH
ncbi:MAG: DUF4249 domain-containing protein [Bacteroidota bacterium]